MSSLRNIFKVVGEEQESSANLDATGHSAGDAQERIRQEITAHPVLIYMKGTPEMPQCGFSAAVMEVFNALGLPYDTRNVLEDNALREGIKSFSDWPTIPQIYVNGEFIGGCDIVTEMHSKGELEPLVRSALEGAK